MKFVRVEDAELRVDHMPRPGAPALLMLNALGTSLEMWDDQVQALSERYELIRFDKRGHGKSTAGSTRELTIERLARDAVRVLEACGVARAHLCGLSIGGMTAMSLAAQWPDRVLKVVLANTAAHMPPQQTWNERIALVLSQGTAPIVEGVLNRWFTESFRTAEPQRVERVRQMLLATDPKGYAACAAAVRDMDLREAIRSITARTLVIAGTQDQGTKVADAEAIAAAIAESRLITLDAAHLSNIERSEAFTAALLDFLGA